MFHEYKINTINATYYHKGEKKSTMSIEINEETIFLRESHHNLGKLGQNRSYE